MASVIKVIYVKFLKLSIENLKLKCGPGFQAVTTKRGIRCVSGAADAS
jgi:hypothetical protein